MNKHKFHQHPLRNELHVNNTVQYQYFLKKNFKYTNNLQIARTQNDFYSFARTQNETVCKIRNKLLKAAQKLKLINHLDLAKSSEVFKFSKPKLLQIIKRFRDLKSLSLYENPILEANLRFTTAWLKRIKHLVSFKGNASSQNGGVFDKENIQKSKMSFKNAINSKDLKRLELIINDGDIILPFSAFSVTLREITVDLVPLKGASGSDNKVILENFEEDDVLGEYNDLEKLEFFIPMTALPLSEMLDSRPNPSKITVLGFCIALIPAHEYFDITYSFKRFENLQSLDLRFLKNSLATDLLEVFEESENLKNLKVSLLIKSEEDLTTLGEALKRIQSLKSIEIKIEGSISESIPEAFRDFFEGIRELSELEILKIHIDLYCRNNNGKIVVEGSLKSFSECLAELKKIKAISFQHDHADWKREFGFLARVLKEKGEKMRGVEIKAPWSGYPKTAFHCKEKEIVMFLKAIENMGGLKKLILTDFEISEEEITNKLFDVIEKRLKKLREVYLKMDLLEAKREMMRKVIQRMLENSVIDDFVLTGTIKAEVNDPDDLRMFNYKDFVVKKPKFKRIQCTCLDLRNFEFNYY